MIITRTPFRISFFGGGTDYPTWYRKHGGSVLATTIDKYCYLSCRYLPPFFEHRIRVVYSRIESCQRIDDIAHPAVREVLRHVGIDRGVEIHHDGDLPARSGMGSSSSFTVGLLHGLYALKGQMPSKHQLALESMYIEQRRLKEVVGSQDQVLAAYGGFNHIKFSTNDEILVTPVTLGSERIQDLTAHLMLFYTGISRTSSEVAESYVQNIEDKERIMGALGAMVEKGLSVLNDGDLIRFGHLLHEGWQIKRSLGIQISNPHVEEIYSRARAAGALGGKLIGAGGGGFMLLFVEPCNRHRVREQLGELIHVPFKFASSGSQVILFEPEEGYPDEDKDRDSRSLRPFQELVPGRLNSGG